MSQQEELDFEYKGVQYLINVNFRTSTVDASFDGHLGGVVHTFKDSCEEIVEESVQIVSCIGGVVEDEEVDPEDVDGLYEYIIELLNERVNKY